MTNYILLSDHTVRQEPDFMAFGKWFETADRRVNKTIVKRWFKTYYVSTVFLGIDHRFLDKGDPILFETMVFYKDMSGIYEDRYCTWEQAEQGHEQVVNYLLHCPWWRIVFNKIWES